MSEYELVVERDLRMAACGFLIVDPQDIEFDADLMGLGFDSVSLVYLFAQVEAIYNIELDPVIVFDCPTLKDLMRYLTTEHAAAVAERISGGKERADADRDR